MQLIEKMINFRNRQAGGITVFTAILVLIVLTLMIFYATRTGLLEQRVSANEVRQKVAFHAAEAAIDQGMEYLMANQELLVSSKVAGFPDGQGGTRDGWVAAGKWSLCTDTLRADAGHPCGGDSPMPENSFFYNDATTGFEIMPIVVPAGADGVTARLTANICQIDLAAPTVCLPLGGGSRGTYQVLTLLGYGYSDCAVPTDVTTCQGRATVAKPLGNFKTLAGTPTVPLVTRSAFPPTGTAIVVPNPNAGGVGVPISVWVNNNPSDHENEFEESCPGDATAILSSGTWNTCELQEWYDREAVPPGTACDRPAGQCSCTAEESLSYRVNGQTTVVGIDVVEDTDFPCDLFRTFFGVEDGDYLSVKSTIPQQLDDCTILDATSSGIFWITGSGCTLNGSTLGSPGNPVIIISAAEETRITGSVTIFGILYVFDEEFSAAEFTGSGTASIYGALIVDASMDKFTGTVNVVYAEDVLLEAADLGGMGAINGGWRDFGLPEFTW
jgi:hypothetical protein